MKSQNLVVLSVVASAATSFLLVTLLHRAPAVTAAASSAESDELARLSKTIAEQQAETARAIAELRSELALSRAGEARLPLGEIDAAVARALEGAAAKSAPAPKTESAPATPAAFDAKAAFASLNDPSLSRADRDALWKKIAEQGELDAVVAMFEKRAADRPDDPAAQYDLGQACIQKLLTLPDGMAKGTWANKADKAFDDTLALDDHHWAARFSKAISLSFWPPMFGKQAEAIHQFEVLVDQQAGQTGKGDFVQTHLVLGNLYLQQGEKEKALAAWQNGLAQFPGNAALMQKIASLQPH
jgi:tetratricopeptide (TPR) repeat protein